jgi:hypothetical protein
LKPSLSAIERHKETLNALYHRQNMHGFVGSNELYDMIFVTANSVVNFSFIINKPRRIVIEKFVSDTQFSGVIGLSMDLPIKFMMYAHVLETINNFSGFRQ